MLNKYFFVTFQSIFFAWWQAFAGITLASSDLLARLDQLRLSRDRRKGGHMTLEAQPV